MTADALALQYPDAARIASAYRELPRQGRLLLSCRAESLSTTLQALEAAGFCAIQINARSLRGRTCEVRSYKGKQGPCYETGRTVSYLGAALAALDDDNHLLVGTFRICEKTARVYQLPPYVGLIRVGDADPALVAKLDAEPVPFDCDTLEADAARLDSLVKTRTEADSSDVVFYPGPFRALVLRDGSILRRGQAARIAAELIPELISRDGLLRAPDAQAAPAECFRHAYAARGAACLLGELPLAPAFVARAQPDLLAVARSPDELKAHLRRVIAENKPQFVLVGSDPRDQLGCCPNAAVGAANVLAEAGVLDCWRAPVPPDACPTAIYAFAGELHAVDGRPQARPDGAFRQRVLAQLTAAPVHPRQEAWRRMLRWLLILLVLGLLGIGLVKKLRKPAAGPPLLELLAPPPGQRWVVVVLRYGEECEQCENLRSYSQEWVQAQGDASLGYGFLDTEERHASHLRITEKLFTTTVLLLELDRGRLVRKQIVDHDRALATYHQRELWQEELASTMAAFRGDAEIPEPSP